MVVNDKVSRQYVSHMCNGQSCKVRGNNQNNSVENNNFVHINRFQPLSDIDLNTVNNCHSVDVSTVVENVGCKNTCDIPVAREKSSTTILKGKKKNLLDFNCNNVLDRGHVKSRKQTEHTVENPTVLSDSEHNEMSNVKKVVISDPKTNNNLTKNVYADKYTLELQNSDQTKRIQEAKAATGNEECMQQNRPLFGFIPIYGLKSRVCDSYKNSQCSDIIELHKKLRSDTKPNYMGLQIPVASKLNHDKWAVYLEKYWDWQLLLLIKYGFPLDFDRNHVGIVKESNIKVPQTTQIMLPLTYKVKLPIMPC